MKEGAMHKGKWSAYELQDDEVRVVIQRKIYGIPRVYAIKGTATIEIENAEPSMYFDNNPIAKLDESIFNITMRGKFDKGNLAKKYSEEKKWRAVTRNIKRSLERVKVWQDEQGNYQISGISKQELYALIQEIKETVNK